MTLTSYLPKGKSMIKPLRVNRLVLISILGVILTTLSGCALTQQIPSAKAQLLQQPTPAATASSVTVSAVNSDETAVVKAVRANLREHPNKSAAVLREVRQGDVLTLVSSSPVGPWYNVRHKDTRVEGWIHGNSIVITNAPVDVGSRAPQQRAKATRRAPNTSSGVNASGTSSGRYYRNVDGDLVPSPVFSKTAPEGATAKCRDGSYSFSRHRSGTCSHHGGVAEWL
jgi:hypothetical protein